MRSGISASTPPSYLMTPLLVLLDVVAATCVILLLMFLFFRYCFLYWARVGIPYTSPSIPGGILNDVLFGRIHIGRVLKTTYDELKRFGHSFGGAYLLNQPIIIPTDPELIQNILSRDFEYFHDRGLYYNMTNEPITVNLFNMNGDRWKQIRSRFVEMLTATKLKQIFEKLSSSSDKCTLYLEQNTRTDEIVDVNEIFSGFIADVSYSTIFGFDDSERSSKRFRDMVRRASKGVDLAYLAKTEVLKYISPAVANLFNIKLIDRAAVDYFKRIVTETIISRRRSAESKNDVFDLFVRLKNDERSVAILNRGNEREENETRRSVNGKGCGPDFDEIIAQACLFSLATIETVSSSVSFCVYELAMNVDVQHKLRDEIFAVLKKHGGHLTYDACSEMPYMETVIDETMRKYPPLVLLNRVVTKDYQISTKSILTKGTEIVVPVFGIHHDPKIYPNPEKFDPERFSAKKKQESNPYLYLPYGQGPRVCIGQRLAKLQIMFCLVNLLKNYQCSTCPKTEKQLEFDPKSLLLRPKNGIWIYVNKRN